MKKIIIEVFFSIFVFITFVFSQQPNELEIENNRINAPDLFNESTPSIQETPESLTGALEEGSKGEEINKTAGVEVKKEATPTPTPNIKETMYKKGEEVLKEKEKTQEEIEQEVKLLFEEGKKYYKIEDYEGAAEIWERIIKNYPTSKQLYDIRYALANAYEYSKKYKKAIKQYQKVIAEKPKSDISKEASFRLGQCYIKTGDLKFAEELFRDLIRRDQNKANTNVIRAYLNIALIYMKKEKYKRVENIYLNIIRYFPGTIWEIQARFQLASFYSYIHEYKKAINQYKLIKYKFKNTEWAPVAALHIGDTYKLAGDYKQAKNAYNRVIFEFYKNKKYVLLAEEKIKELKHIKALEQKINEY